MNDDDLAELLATLKIQHRGLDEEIARMQSAGNCDPMELARIKKRKLSLKDEIQQLSDRLIPDIIA